MNDKVVEQLTAEYTDILIQSNLKIRQYGITKDYFMLTAYFYVIADLKSEQHEIITYEEAKTMIQDMYKELRKDFLMDSFN